MNTSIEEEFRSQNSEVRINKSGIQTGAGIVAPPNFLVLWGCKNADYSDAPASLALRSTASHTEYPTEF
ncbi:hypothetical protein [Nostoc sp. CALU 546]|uniref:hypothetical protein n=1 Tax=Nostoc sp. CALU 546 TaxID=1867241 RepID=UPI003B6726EB